MKRGLAILAAVLVVSLGPAPAADATPFQDIQTSAHRESILELVERGITRGCAELAFCPGNPVTRAQMASFLVRALELPAASAIGMQPRMFADVAVGSTHAAAIGSLLAEGVTHGCAPDRFCPDAPVTRAQMATFLVRARNLPVDGSSDFSDVPSGSVHAAAIGALATSGVTRGCSAGLFCPDAAVNREQMASFLLRLLDLPPDPSSGRWQLYYSTSPDGSDARPLRGAVVRGTVYVFLAPAGG